MIETKRFALNRIISPSMSLSGFYAFTAGLGLAKVELRNDIRDGKIVDGINPAEAARMASDNGIRVISINALQKFNLASARARAKAELKQMLDLCGAINCPAVVLCPNNDPADARSPGIRLAETVDSLVEFGPMFEKAGILGYIEPLGFAISSLASLATAQVAIKDSGFGCYRVLIDTFHNYIGPETLEVVGSAFSVAMTGLVHVSGVEADIPVPDYRDEHRILAGPADRMKSRDLVRKIQSLGYEGDYSFEPFSPEVQALPPDRLAAGIRASLRYLSE